MGRRDATPEPPFLGPAMKLRQLLASLTDVRVSGDPDADVGEVRDDSRSVGRGDVFVAVPGSSADGRGFLADAAARGAGVLVFEQPPAVLPGSAAVVGASPASGVLPPGTPPDFHGIVVTVPDARHALAIMAANRFGAARALTLSAVTGTNGKTTSTYLMESILAAAGIRAGVVGTIGYRLAPPGEGDARGGTSPAAGSGAVGDAPTSFTIPAPLTTPGALALQRLFADMRAAGASDVVLEASSHALDQRRLDGCSFAVAGLTNLTQDHLDYHGTMAAYLDAKAILFERLLDPARGVAVLPVDLPEGRAMRDRARGRTTLGVAATIGTTGADIVAESVRMTAAGFRARLATPSGPLEIASPLVGDFNLANIVLAVGMAFARGIPMPAIVAGIERLAGVPGRLERVDNDRGVLCVVDYAHTPDAMERAIAAVRPLVGAGGRLLTVFGCGGDRDRTKRPLMGQAAARGSDLAIVTSDNPRHEEPETIIAMIVAGIRELDVPALDAAVDDAGHAPARGYLVVADRRSAIRRAVAAARVGDVVLIAGKGHEDYQIVGATRLRFDDREEARAAFRLVPSQPPQASTDDGQGAGGSPDSAEKEARRR